MTIPKRPDIHITIATYAGRIISTVGVSDAAKKIESTLVAALAHCDKLEEEIDTYDREGKTADKQAAVSKRDKLYDTLDRIVKAAQNFATAFHPKASEYSDNKAFSVKFAEIQAEVQSNLATHRHKGCMNGDTKSLSLLNSLAKAVEQSTQPQFSFAALAEKFKKAFTVTEGQPLDATSRPWKGM